MTDYEIIGLYNERNQEAVAATQDKYGAYCMKIAFNILSDRRDSEECVNDTYLQAWNTIPPQFPKVLRAFLGKITRNLSIDTLRKRKSVKRGAGEIDIIFEELEECIPGEDQIESAITQAEITEAVNEFLSGLSYEQRKLFVKRYWYAETLASSAASLGMSESKAASALFRMRKRLREHFNERGLSI